MAFNIKNPSENNRPGAAWLRYLEDDNGMFIGYKTDFDIDPLTPDRVVESTIFFLRDGVKVDAYGVESEEEEVVSSSSDSSVSSSSSA